MSNTSILSKPVLRNLLNCNLASADGFFKGVCARALRLASKQKLVISFMSIQFYVIFQVISSVTLQIAFKWLISHDPVNT